MQPQAFYRAVADDFSAVDGIIKKQLTSRVPLVSKIGDYITSAGGKRLRPLLVLLCGKALGREGDDMRLLAATIEFLHTATLLHDDVVDMSGMRRGRSTANAMWGNAPSVLVGDFLYSRSFEMMVELGSMQVMKILSQATRIIAEGEVLQLSKVRDASTTEETYMEVIRGKTAMLFEASTHSAAALAGATPEQSEALRTFGDHLGVAFQLVDDLLDYRGDAETLGKNVGDDLAEGKPTLPLIYTMREGTAEQAALVRQAIQKGGIEDLESIRAAVEASGSLDYTAQLARDYVARAISCLEALRTFGDHLGVAFQLVDDLLDYKGDAETLGKNVGDDLAEGKPTLPLIYTMREGTPEQAALVRKAIQKGGIEDLESIREAVEASGSLEYTAKLARDYVARAIKCLDALPASEYRDALVELSEFAVARTH